MDDNEDEFGADEEFLAALVASDPIPSYQVSVEPKATTKIVQSTPHRISHLDPAFSSASGLAPLASPQSAASLTPEQKVVQPTPQILTSRSTTSSILVSPRQKGNSILTNLRSFAWEYSEILADYVLGSTTCALFLSLKYHRLHPEYIYNRIKGLQGKYSLRILLTLVDITNHEDSLKELTKTSLINHVTIILCWSATEAARYLELYKSFEHSKDPVGIKGIEKRGYGEKMVEFITTPRGINKTDAVSIVSAFGSIRGSINARPEEIAVVGGWGEKKVRRWCSAIDEPFQTRRSRVENKKAYENILGKAMHSSSAPTGELANTEIRDINQPRQDSQESSLSRTGEKELSGEMKEQSTLLSSTQDNSGDKEANKCVTESEENPSCHVRREHTNKEDELSSGISVALAKLRQNI